MHVSPQGACWIVAVRENAGCNYASDEDLVRDVSHVIVGWAMFYSSTVAEKEWIGKRGKRWKSESAWRAATRVGYG